MELVLALTVYVVTAAMILKKPSRFPVKRLAKAALWPWFALKALASWLADRAWGA